jgi:hypothetical protein
MPNRTATETVFAPGYSVIKCACDAGYEWAFKMKSYDISVGAYYRGKLVVTDALNPAIVGTVFNGFFDFSQHPELNTLDSWMTCVVQDTMDWFCVHDPNGLIKSLGFAEVNGEFQVPANTDVIVIEGQLTFNGSVFTELGCVPSSDQPIVTSGTAAKVFFITKQ